MELRFVDRDGREAMTVYNNCVAQLTIRQTSGAINLLEASLRAPRGAGLGRVHEDSIVEVWIHDAQGVNRVGTFRAEYVQGDIQEGGEQVRVQGRSLCGNLVDRPVSLRKDGSIGEVLLALAPDALAISDEIPEDKVSVYFDVPSTFGAIRLLCTSTRLVAKDAGDKLAILTRAEVMRKIQARPVPKITDKDINAAQFQRGKPIRTREE